MILWEIPLGDSHSLQHPWNSFGESSDDEAADDDDAEEDDEAVYKTYRSVTFSMQN